MASFRLLKARAVSPGRATAAHCAGVVNLRTSLSVTDLIKRRILKVKPFFIKGKLKRHYPVICGATIYL